MWKYFYLVHGEQFLMMELDLLMLELYVDNLDTPHILVRLIIKYIVACVIQNNHNKQASPVLVCTDMLCFALFVDHFPTETII